MDRLIRFCVPLLALFALAPVALAGSELPPPPQVPEPGTIALVVAGAAALVLARRRKRD